MLTIIVNSDPRYPVDKTSIRSTVEEVLLRYKVTGKTEIGVNIVGDRKMHEINKKYRGLDSTTNILTFALEDVAANKLAHLPRVGFVASPDQVLRLGDIIISYPQVVEDAGVEGVSVDEEMRILVEHGVKHLLGLHGEDH